MEGTGHRPDGPSASVTKALSTWVWPLASAADKALRRNEVARPMMADSLQKRATTAKERRRSTEMQKRVRIMEDSGYKKRAYIDTGL